MKGLVRPCRHQLGPELQERWLAHLCGLCLTLRDEVGQTARVLTGYDALLLSVLVEAQAGRQPTRTAGRCPLRAMRTAEVVDSAGTAMTLAAAGSLLTGSAGLRDKLADRDLPYGTRAVAGMAAGRYGRAGRTLAGRIGLDPSVTLDAAARAAAVESRVATLDELLSPTGAVVAALFAHTAAVSGHLGNERPLAAAGDAYGRLVHLLDAVDDLTQDARGGRFNPLAATGTTRSQAHDLAGVLAGEVRREIGAVVMVDPELALVLLGPGVDRAVSRTFAGAGAAPQLVLAGALAGVTLCGPRRRQRRRGHGKGGHGNGGRGSDNGCGNSGCCDNSWCDSDCIDCCCDSDCCGACDCSC